MIWHGQNMAALVL